MLSIDGTSCSLESHLEAIIKVKFSTTARRANAVCGDPRSRLFTPNPNTLPRGGEIPPSKAISVGLHWRPVNEWMVFLGLLTQGRVVSIRLSNHCEI